MTSPRAALSYAELLEAVAESHRTVEATLEGVDRRAGAGAVAAAGGGAGGHVVTHLARNADALNRFAVGGVITGEAAPEMYPGGPAARAAAIEEGGAGRPAELLVADFRFAGRRVIESLLRITEDLYETPVNWRQRVPARQVPVLRWRELEIHHVDLGARLLGDRLAGGLRGAHAGIGAARAGGPVSGRRGAGTSAHRTAGVGYRAPTREGLPPVPAWPF